MRVVSATGLLLAFIACAEGPAESGPDAAPSAVNKPSAPVDHEAAFADAKRRLERGELEGLDVQLRTIANEAKDPTTRANAALALGAILEEKGDRPGAISSYRLAQRLMPEEPAPLAVLGLALFAAGQVDEAIEAQRRLVELTPDDLRAWLLLGEMAVKHGDEEGAKQAYASYEVRRKGLLDGLTLAEEGSYRLSPDERVRTVEFLEAAVDEGTGLALLYALGSDPDRSVRDAIVETMGIQRLRGYEEGLRKHLEKETDEASRKLARWALDEIARDPVDIGAAEAPTATLEAPLPPGAVTTTDGPTEAGTAAPPPGEPPADAGRREAGSPSP